ncbi:MAG TPA: PilZ domain-containing protein [Minicystis sp.]|nr:PilZ domain-containing protein [Minicystis sp.]
MNRIVAPKLQRQAFRRAVRLSCQVVRERDFRLVGELALDLSTEGMLALARLPVLTGEPVLVTFYSARQARWFDVEARVARVLHGRRAGDPGRCLGIAFDGADAAFREGVFEHLRRMPPAPRRRALDAPPELAVAPLFSAAQGGLAVALPS